MNARQSTLRKVNIAPLLGALLAVASFNAVAESTATLDQRAPVAATLLPGLKVTASISNPSAPLRWRLSPGRPQPVTLMPTLRVTADVMAVATTTLTRTPSMAQAETSALATSPALAVADGVRSRPSTLGITN